MRINKTKQFLILFSCIFTFNFLRLTVHANSSWQWLTNSSPMEILPFAIIATLIVEFFVIYKFGLLTKERKSMLITSVTIIVICFVNLISFLVPHFLWVFPDEFGRSPTEAWYNYANHWSSFIVGIGFLIVTLIVEVPIVYFSLKRFTENKKRLIIVIVVVNVATTIAIAIIERIVFKGVW